MTWIVLAVIAVLLIGLAPLRRAAFGRRGITFTLPAAVGAAIGLTYGLWVEAYSATMIPELPLICATVGAFIMGTAGKKALDDLFHNRGD